MNATNPVPLGLKKSFGFGDRTGLATPGHLRASKKYDFAPIFAQWQREQAKQLKSGAQDPQLEQFRWLLEELRVQLFAQELKTPVPVSAKRLTKIWQTMNR